MILIYKKKKKNQKRNMRWIWDRVSSIKLMSFIIIIVLCKLARVNKIWKRLWWNSAQKTEFRARKLFLITIRRLKLKMKKFRKVIIKKKLFVLFLQSRKWIKWMLIAEKSLCNQMFPSIQFLESSQHFMDRIKRYLKIIRILKKKFLSLPKDKNQVWMNLTNRLKG